MHFSGGFKMAICVMSCCLIIFGVAGKTTAQQHKAYTIPQIRDSLLEQYNRVEDFAAKVRIDMDLPGFRMPRKMVEVLFKQPDKFKVESVSFAIVPKSGLLLSPERIFSSLADLQQIDIAPDELWLQGKLNPDSSTFRMGQSPSEQLKDKLRLRFQIDSHHWVITEIQTIADTMTFLTVRSTYNEVKPNIWLPDKTVLSFSMPGNVMGNQRSSEMNSEDLQEALKEMKEGGKTVRGSVTVDFLNYKVNTGLSDDLFKKETFN